jgi:CRISPR-associated protein Csx17
LSLSSQPQLTEGQSNLSVGKIQETKKGKKPILKLTIAWSDAAKDALRTYLDTHLSAIRKIIVGKDEWPKPTGKKKDGLSAVQKKFEEKGGVEYVFDIKDGSGIDALPADAAVTHPTRVKESGKKSVMVHVGKALANEPSATAALKLGRDYFAKFQAADADVNALLETLRDVSPFSTAEALDSIFTTHRGIRRIPENPVFLSKGEAGAGEIFRTFWGFYLELREKVSDNVERSLFDEKTGRTPSKAIGSPFFPDSIKTYNLGAGWVEDKYPFTALDYILAVEGAFAMRGSVSRTLGANTRRFAAFPFVFDSGEDLVDDANKVKGTASSLWFPLWERPAAYEELSSFICDAQARLPRKEARFSAEFLRAMHSQGVDAGFSGWQEFRFRMKGSRVPWVTAGHFTEAKYNASATLLNRALEPFDATRFIEQFEIIWEGGAASAKSPHRIRVALNAAVENAFVATTAENSLEILCAVFEACKKLAVSKSFRENSRLQHPAFFAPLPMPEWRELLRDLEDVPEFEIARAIASIVGQQPQRNGKYSKVQPLLGSLLPLKLGQTGWYLPTDKDRSNQAVWSGIDLCRDLAAILQRRYMDSAKEDYPALQAVFPARLESILAFLNGELDDHKIARWTEALSLIGWRFDERGQTSAHEETEKNEHSTPLAYAALRSLLDAELAYQKPETYKRRRSEQPIAQLCACSSHTLAQATREALRYLSIWGVPNPWDEKSRAERSEMKGAYIVRLDECALQLPEELLPSARIAAAVTVPLVWRDRWQLHRLVTLPTNQ